MPELQRPEDANDRQRFLDALEAHGAALMRVSSAYVTVAADREDLFQEICLAIWRALPGFRGECSLRTFVFRIGHNRGLTFRARQRRPDTPLDDVAEPPSGQRPADELVDHQHRVGRLLQAVRQLPALQREAMVLHLEGLTTPEIATVLGISENNTAVRLTRARNDLRARLGGLSEA